MNDLRDRLYELSDEKYKEFHMNLCPNVNNIIGVRIPKLRELAKEVAKKLNKPSMSAQAIGNAIGHNPISIIIPCHRVIGKNGSLTGYAGGIENKIKLLELEGMIFY